MQLKSATGQASLAEEQAALRRVATLVAEGSSADDVLAAVAREVGGLFGVGTVNIDRYENGESLVLAAFDDPSFPVGSRWPLDGQGVRTLVYETGRPARVEDFTGLPGTAPAAARAAGIRSAVAVPVVVAGQVWGVLGFGSKEEEPLPADTEQRLAAFTELVSTAIANSDARAKVGLLLDEQAALRRVATLVAEGAPPNEVLDAVAVEVGRLIGGDFAVLSRYEQGGGVTVLSSRPAGTDREPPFASPTIDPESLTAAVIRTGRPARIDDFGEAPGPWSAKALELGRRSAVAAPLTVQGSLWGVMAVVSTEAHAWPYDTEDRLVAFTELLATAIANTESRTELAASEARARELAEEQAALRRVATLVARDVQAREIFSAVSEEVGRVFGSDYAGVGRFEPDGSAVVIVGVSEGINNIPVGTRWPLEEFLATTTVYRTGRPARNERSGWEDSSSPVAESLRQLGLVSTVAAPIVVEGNVWGVVTVSDAHQPLPSDAEERLAAFTELVATAIANAESRAHLAESQERTRELANEQAALRRVATLVAQGAGPHELFSAVAKEVAGVIDVPVVGINRYEADGTYTIVGNAGESTSWIGTSWPFGDKGLSGRILATGRPARQDDFIGIRDTLGDPAGDAPSSSWREKRSIVGAPIIVEGSVWGNMAAAAAPGTVVPAGTEERLARFTELIATAVSNATTRTELLASRARLVSAADESRRRLERDLHDGIQQWLVALALRARRAAELGVSGASAVEDLTGLADDLVRVTDELRELSHGIHPAILSDAGLDDALEALGRRSAIPVELDVNFDGRYDPTLEATVYYVAAESITNAVKHAQAATVTVRGGRRDGTIELEISDDGIGGADPRRGTGLIGLVDRVDTLGGTISFESPAGAGTTIRVKLPAGSSG